MSIPELPSPLDDWVGCAYLVCRMIDTLEDRPGIGETERQRLFDQLIDILGPPVDLQAARRCAARFAGFNQNDPCSVLMSRTDAVMTMLSSFPESTVRVIRRCAVEMTDGLRRTPLPPMSQRPVCLFKSMHQLERYCHYAAGIVGVMLTRLFAQYLGRDTATIDRTTLHRAKRFGRGLQLTNIIKDHPADLADGRCFIPTEVALKCRRPPNNLLQPSLPIDIRGTMVRRASSHLDAALEYCLAIPSRAVGLRLFCVQPLMMALLTLERVITHPNCTPDDRPKITRRQVNEVLCTSRAVSGDDPSLRQWYGRLRRGLNDVLKNT